MKEIKNLNISLRFGWKYELINKGGLTRRIRLEDMFIKTYYINDVRPLKNDG